MEEQINETLESQIQQKHFLKSQKEQSIKIKESRINNRRYKKLLELRKNDFFSEEAIKLRHPLLFHTYVGQYKLNQNNSQNESIQKYQSISQFLADNLLNLEYKELLQQQIKKEQKDTQVNLGKSKKLSFEPIISEEKYEDQDELSSDQSLQNFKENLMQSEEDDNQMVNDGFKKVKIVESTGRIEALNKYEQNEQNERFENEQEMGLQEQNLIDHVELLFLQGKLICNEIHYNEIDYNEDYDDLQQEGQDLEEKYFQSQSDSLDSHHDYTGIQDY